MKKTKGIHRKSRSRRTEGNIANKTRNQRGQIETIRHVKQLGQVEHIGQAKQMKQTQQIELKGHI